MIRSAVAARDAPAGGAATPWAGLLCGAGLLGFTAVVVGYGWTHTGLGLPYAPFFAFYHPLPRLWAIPGLGLLAGSVAVAPVLLRARRGLFLAGSAGLALVARCGLGMSRFGPAEWARPFIAKERHSEYIQTVPQVPHMLGLLESFARRVPHLPTHSAGHPPGPTLIAVSLNHAGLGGPWPLAAVIIAAGAATAPLTYLLASRLVDDERTARVACLAWVFAPASMIESVTSMDAVFALLAVAVALALVCGRRWLGGAGVWLLSFMSYALAAVPVWAAIVVWQRRSLRSAIVLATSALAVTAGAYLALRLTIGYDLIGAFKATRVRYLHGPGSDARHRPQSFWFWGDLAAFLAGLGIPLVLAYGRRLAARAPEAWALAVIAVTAAAGTFSKGEVERIWLFMVPLAAVAAAPALARWPLRLTLALLAVQAATVEILFATVW